MSPDTVTHHPASILSTPSDREIRLERVFRATRARVWRAYTDPTQLARWWGRGNRLTIERYEFVRGGHWRFVEHTDHGDFGFEGRFREIVPEERLSQTFEFDGMPGHVGVGTATFEDLGDGTTKMVTTSLFLTTEDRDGMLQSGMKTGADQSYAALDRLLEAS